MTSQTASTVVEITTTEHGRTSTHTATLDDAGVLRWVSNGNVPFADMVQQFIDAGHPASLEACEVERDRQSAESIARYQAQRERTGYSSEELFEMRAAFGEGAEVVDVFTGRKINL